MSAIRRFLLFRVQKSRNDPQIVPACSFRWDKSRGQTVGAAEQELCVLDAQAAQQHGQAVDAQTEAAVGRAAVLEELQIELDILGQALLLSCFFSTS